MQIDPPGYEDEEELTSRRSFWVWLVAAVLALAVASAFGINLFLDVAPDVLRPAGDPDEYAFLHLDPKTGEPARYNPCEPIHYVVNKSAAPAGALVDLEEGIEIMSETAGVDFVFDGFVETGVGHDRTSGNTWAPVLFTWVPPDELLSLNDHAVGAAASSYVLNKNGELVYVTGVVTFNSEAKLLPGFKLGDSRGDVVLHEIGHLLGLAHVDDSTQVMYPDVTGGEARLGAGDLTGLRRLGREAGCLKVPSPDSAETVNPIRHSARPG